MNIKRATGLTEGELETERRRPGELTRSLVTGGLRPRTVSKPRRSLQGGCGPPVPLATPQLLLARRPAAQEWKHSENSQHRGTATDWRPGRKQET